MTSPNPSRREDEALLHAAATALRRQYNRLQAEDALAGKPWGTTADYEILHRAERLDRDARAIGRGELEASRRAAAVEEARRIFAEASAS